MQTCGIIAEYNPFHRGHAAQIKKIRQIFSERVGIVLAMSGSFTQRGEPAILDLSHRVQTALNQGCDLVIEIPVEYVLNSAESFATAAVKLFAATGVVRNIAYGCEDSSQSSLIKEIAHFLNNESREFKQLLEQYIKEGYGYAAARSKAVAVCLGKKEADNLLKQSNNILAIEYERALENNNIDIPTVALELYKQDKYSASAARQLLYKSHATKAKKAQLITALSTCLTPRSLSQLLLAYQENKAVVLLDDFADLIDAEQTVSPWKDLEKLKEIQGMQAGLAERFTNYIQNRSQTLVSKPNTKENLTSFLNQIASRNFPLSRVRRAFFSALLNIKAEETLTTEPQFIRVLGFSKNGQLLLRYMKDCSSLPVITRSSDWQEVTSTAGIRQKELCFAAGNLWKSRLSTAQNVEESRKVILPEQIRRK